MSDTAETRTERWRYLGRRELHKGGLGTLYETAGGETALFAARRPPAVIGDTYEVTLASNDDALTMIGAPRFLQAPDPGEPEIGRLEAEDRGAATAQELRKLEQRARAQSPERFGTVTLAELRQLYDRCPYPRRAALLAQAIRHITAT